MNKPSEMRACSFLRIVSWATYDLANTIFAINILSLYFPLWLIKDRGGSDLLYASASSASLFLASCLMPFLGTLSDHLRKRMIFLIPTTLFCVMATGFLSRASSLKSALLLFGIAHLNYQLGLVFYDALLPHVSSSKMIGRVSGIGVALGYVGTLVGLALVRPYVLTRGHQAAFLPTAIFFFLFSLPCFCMVRDPSGDGHSSPNFSLVREAKERFKKGIGQFGEGTPLRQFLGIHFFSLLAIQPVILFMSIYTQNVIGLNDREMITFFFLTTLSAIPGSFISGILTDLVGPRRTLLFSLGGWCLGLLGALIAIHRWHFLLSGSILGAALGATWVSGRVLVIRLSSPEYLGEIFGCVGLVGRIAAILGPLLWGGIVLGLRDYFPLNYRAALLCLLFWVLISFLLLVKRLPESFFGGTP